MVQEFGLNYIRSEELLLRWMEMSAVSDSIFRSHLGIPVLREYDGAYLFIYFFNKKIPPPSLPPAMILFLNPTSPHHLPVEYYRNSPH